MDESTFLDGVNALLEVAYANGYTLTREDIAKTFSEELKEKDLKVLYSYLKSKGVTVAEVQAEEGIFGDDTVSESVGERELLGILYADDLKELADLRDDVNLLEVHKRFSKGDDEAREKLIECLLCDVVSWVEAFENDWMMSEDLIANGNMCLLRAVDDVKEESFKDEETLVNTIRDLTLDYLGIIVNEENEGRLTWQSSVTKIEEFRENAKLLKEKLDRPVTVEEVMDFMDMDEEDMRSILDLLGSNADILEGI